MKAGGQSSMIHRNWAFKDILPGRKVGKSMRLTSAATESTEGLHTEYVRVVSAQAKRQTVALPSMALYGGRTS